MLNLFQKTAGEALLAGACLTLNAVTFNVPGTSDPWLANATIDNVGTPEPPDTAPAQSPVSAGPVNPGDTISWSATGLVGHPGDVAGPDGAPGVPTSHLIGASNGIADLTANINALIGVWAFPGGGGIPFIMGSSGSAVVPGGVNELFLGTMDGYGWANNTGSFDVSIRVVGAPDGGSTLGLLALAGGLLGLRSRRA